MLTLPSSFGCLQGIHMSTHTVSFIAEGKRGGKHHHTSERTEVIFVLQVADSVTVDKLIPSMVRAARNHAAWSFVKAVARELKYVWGRRRRVGTDDKLISIAEDSLLDPVHEFNAGHDLVLHTEGQLEFEVAALLHGEASLLHLCNTLRGIKMEDDCGRHTCMTMSTS